MLSFCVIMQKMNALNYQKIDFYLEEPIYRLLSKPDNELILLIGSLFDCHILCKDNYLYISKLNNDLHSKFIIFLKLFIERFKLDANISSSTLISLYKNNVESQIDDTWSTILLGYTFAGKPIYSKTYNQYKMCKLIKDNIITFVSGQAGTGKTFLAVLMAVKALKSGDVNKIILSRPAVEAGESLGYLPGDFKDKIDPYLMPLYDFLELIVGAKQIQNYLDKNIIEILPLAYMRGRSFNNAYIILDEAQNTTAKQMLMFLSRLGSDSKMIITGDISQIDIKESKENNGLCKAISKLKNVNNIGILNFTISDVVRHPLIIDIIKRFAIN